MMGMMGMSIWTGVVILAFALPLAAIGAMIGWLAYDVWRDWRRERKAR